MIVALLALFVALGGSSYAAVKIGARDIQRGAVGTRAIANNSIRSGDIHNATVSGRRRQGRLADQRRHRQHEPHRQERGNGRPGHHGHDRENGRQRD